MPPSIYPTLSLLLPLKKSHLHNKCNSLLLTSPFWELKFILINNLIFFFSFSAKMELITKWFPIFTYIFFLFLSPTPWPNQKWQTLEIWYTHSYRSYQNNSKTFKNISNNCYFWTTPYDSDGPLLSWSPYQNPHDACGLYFLLLFSYICLWVCCGVCGTPHDQTKFGTHTPLYHM